MDSTEIYIDIISKIKDINKELCKKLEYLRPYFVYDRIPSKRSEVEKQFEGLNINGKTRDEYFDNMPQYDKFESSKAFYLAVCQYRLETITNAKNDADFQEDYNRLVHKLMRFTNNASSLSSNDVKMGSESFARDIVNVCAKNNIPFLDTFRYTSEVYKILIKRAKIEIELHDTKDATPQKRV